MEVFNPHLFEEPPAGGVTLLKSEFYARTKIVKYPEVGCYS